MDTSETYIKMSQKLPQEMQKQWDSLDMQVLPTGILYRGNDVYAIRGENIIKLYRQDQLQAMSAVKGAMGQMVALWNAIDDDVFYDCLGEASWEQLWLAFVIKEKYNKTWNGDEWVNE